MDISIIVPTRNRLWSLPRAVESCMSVSISVEIIVIDDGSTDGTADWLRLHPELVVLDGAGWGKPWGVTRALAIATGTYVRFLDSDDWLKPEANERQFAIAERENADVVVAGYDLFQDEQFVESHSWIECDDFIAQQLGEAPASHYSAYLFRRSFISGIPHRTLFPASDFASRDDRCMVLEVALRKPRIAICPSPTLCHRQHRKERLQFRQGLRNTGTTIQHLYIYRQILSLLESRDELTERRKRAAIKALWPLAHWIAYTHLTDAGELVDWIYELDPQFEVPEDGILGLLYRRLGFRRTERLLHLRRVAMSIFR
jgi:glycosyltransferase involved in cell wall biosynthesis